MSLHLLRPGWARPGWAIAVGSALAGAFGACAPSSVNENPRPVVPEASAKPEAKPADDVAQKREALDALLAEHWEYYLRRNPEYASIIGDHRYDANWSDRTEASIARDLEEQRRFRERFAALDTDGLSESDLLNQRLMLRGIDETLEHARFQDWLMPVNQMSGPHLDLPQLVSLLRFETQKDYESYLERLRTVPRVFAEAEALMRAGLKQSLVPPRAQLELALRQTEGLAGEKPEATPFAEPLGAFPEAVPSAEQVRLRTGILAAIADQVLPAYRGFADFLRQDYVPHGRKEPGVWSLPDGEARYRAAIQANTTTNMSPAEIHEIGLREVARIEAEQEAIGKRLGFKDLRAFGRHIKAEKKFRPATRQEILDRYQKHTDAMYAELPKLFGRLPAQRMRILPTEEFREKDAAGAEYQQGSPDGSRPGTVRVNTANPSARLWVDMESTAYHEGVPGHHLQLTIQMELPLPPFRQFGGYTAFFEGWALYAERLGKDVGFFEDPYSDYGRLQDELLRAIRLVVDTGVHFKKWSRDDVVRFFHEHSTIDEPSVQAETNRYIVWPGQALAYKIGQLAILRLREKAKAELGQRFDLRAFHDQVLEQGALPLDMLEARIDAWIATERGAGA